MNWDVFSTNGYVSVALWLGIPVLWLLHTLIKPRRWIAHLAVPLAVIALVLATMNSRGHISLIEVDRTAEELEQFNQEAARRQAVLDERADEAAGISFAEDAESDKYDAEGLNNQDLQYFDEAAEGSAAQPDWRQQRERQQREHNAGDDDSLEAQIGARQEREGVAVSETFNEAEEQEPIYMSEEDVYLANRLNRANLSISKWSIIAALGFLVFDYVRRLNIYRESYFPLPLPSAWPNALTPPQPVMTLPKKPRRSLQRELHTITRRGDVFVYVTDDAQAAKQAAGPMPRLPLGLWPRQVLPVAGDARLTDDFVFETLWFGRNSFVVDSVERGHAMLGRFTQLLAERRRSRAHTRQTVHIVWDIAQPLPDHDLQRLATLCKATGYTLLLHSKPVSAPTPVTTPTKAEI